MFKRFAANFALIFLFAFAQVGAITHEISHIGDYIKHSQQDPSKQDKNTHGEQCKQCISYAEVASGLQAQPIIFSFSAGEFAVSIFSQQTYSLLTHTAYAARAPPQIS